MYEAESGILQKKVVFTSNHKGLSRFASFDFSYIYIIYYETLNDVFYKKSSNHKGLKHFFLYFSISHNNLLIDIPFFFIIFF